MQETLTIDRAADEIKSVCHFNEYADKIEINREGGLISVTTHDGFNDAQLDELSEMGIEFSRCYARINGKMTVQFNFDRR